MLAAAPPLGSQTRTIWRGEGSQDRAGRGGSSARSVAAPCWQGYQARGRDSAPEEGRRRRLPLNSCLLLSQTFLAGAPGLRWSGRGARHCGRKGKPCGREHLNTQSLCFEKMKGLVDLGGGGFRLLSPGLSSLPWHPGLQRTFVPFVTEAHTGEVTCSRSPRQEVAELALEPGSVSKATLAY